MPPQPPTIDPAIITQTKTRRRVLETGILQEGNIEEKVKGEKDKGEKEKEKDEVVVGEIGRRIYPPFCHDASTTLGRWCPLRGGEVRGLRDVGMMVPEAPGSSKVYRLFHHGNHPVKWVKIIGVVVAVDEFTGRRVYTIDDSSGVCVECCCSIPITTTLDINKNISTATNTGNGKAKDSKNGSDTGKKGEEETKEQSVDHPNVPYGLIDVGCVVKIKGRVGCFRDVVQVEVVSAVVVRETEVEIKFWDEALKFREDVLQKEWVLNDIEVEELRKKDERRRKREIRKKREKGRNEPGVLQDERTSRREPMKDKIAAAIQAKKVNHGVDAALDDRNAARMLLEQEMLKRTHQSSAHDGKRKRNDGPDATRKMVADERNERRRTGQAGDYADRRRRYPSLAVRKAAAGKYDLLGI